MRIGVPREIKTLEGRVALVPAAVAQLVAEGHSVLVEQGAGVQSGYDDARYHAAGAELVADAAAFYGGAELIVKVKEPLPEEVALLRKDQLLFSFLHLAAATELMQQLREVGLTAVAFETVETDSGQLPLLAPMSDIAGRVAVQVGAHLLHRPQGGKGILLGGLPAAERGRVVILGAGVAGGNAALLAAAMGAEVTVFDRNRDKLVHMRALGNNVTALHPYPDALHEAVVAADLLIGAVLIPGKRAPHLVSADTVREMGEGSAIIDIAVDQGGCIETTRPTTYADPTFVIDGVTHFGVTNMPGAVPRSASQALSAALTPYVSRLAGGDWQADTELRRGLNVDAGEIIHPALQELVI
ncbi:MAG TPA: alanine dehydrogenase [Chromatiales bacterium]|nr:alanine dehydrogenase [Chromatiales bacterium]HEX22447.1 alanine dehydrogenase [Chromatiales bacterium]